MIRAWVVAITVLLIMVVFIDQFVPYLNRGGAVAIGFFLLLGWCMLIQTYAIPVFYPVTRLRVLGDLEEWCNLPETYSLKNGILMSVGVVVTLLIVLVISAFRVADNYGMSSKGRTVLILFNVLQIFMFAVAVLVAWYIYTFQTSSSIPYFMDTGILTDHVIILKTGDKVYLLLIYYTIGALIAYLALGKYLTQTDVHVFTIYGVVVFFCLVFFMACVRQWSKHKIRSNSTQQQIILANPDTLDRPIEIWSGSNSEVVIDPNHISAYPKHGNIFFPQDGQFKSASQRVRQFGQQRRQRQRFRRQRQQQGKAGQIQLVNL